MDRLCKILTTIFIVCFIVSSANGISSIFRLPIFDSWVSNNNQTTTLFNVTVDDDKVCIPPLLIHGSVDPVKNDYKSQDVVRIQCSEGYELENPQSSLLYCSSHGLWQVFTLAGENVQIPLPRCIIKRHCPPLPPLMQGSMQVQEEGDNGLSGTGLSSTRAVYQCWFGLELEPAESEVRYCIQGKWTGENPQCVRSGCNRPPPVANGFYTSRGIINQVYPTGTTVKYHCDSDHQMIGASVFTCIRRDWMPKDLPTCKPIVKADQNGEGGTVRGCPLPPPILRGEYQILPWRRGVVNGGNGNGNYSSAALVPIHSSAIYACHRGYILRGGSSLISCSARGWWQPPYNTPRCVPSPFGSSYDMNVNNNNIKYRLGDGRTTGARIRGGDEEEDDEMERPTPGPLLLSVTTAFGVIFVLSLIWIASRWKISCRKTQTSSSVNGGNTVSNGNGNVCHTAIGPSSSFASDGDVSGTTRTSLWDWINQQQNRASASSRRLLRTDEESAAIHTTEDLQQHHLDRVALIAYISDSQATLPSYEEAIRSVGAGAWPAAPPSYESILVETSTTTTTMTVVTATPSPATATLTDANTNHGHTNCVETSMDASVDGDDSDSTRLLVDPSSAPSDSSSHETLLLEPSVEDGSVTHRTPEESADD